MKNIYNLQIVRGIASTSVVYFHVGIGPQFGSFGVDIFFVLSGFVIALIINKNLSPQKFLTDRLARIVPLYWLMTITLFIVATFLPSILNSATASLEQLLKSLLFIPFFRLNGDMYPLLGVGWTLNYEMLFYITVFLSMLLVDKKRIFVASVALVIGYFFFGNFNTNTLIKSYLGNSLIFEFVLGIFVFKIIEYSKTMKTPNYIFILMGMAAFVFMAIVESSGMNENRLLLLGAPSALLIFSAVKLERDSDFALGKIRSILVKVGDASYATYLSHYFVIAVFQRVLDIKYGWVSNSIINALFLILSALIIGQILYTLIDKPLHLFFKKKFANFFSDNQST